MLSMFVKCSNKSQTTKLKNFFRKLPIFYHFLFPTIWLKIMLQGSSLLLLLQLTSTIPEEAKILTISMATSRDNKQAPCGSFQYVLTNNNSKLYCRRWK